MPTSRCLGGLEELGKPTPSLRSSLLAGYEDPMSWEESSWVSSCPGCTPSTHELLLLLPPLPVSPPHST